MHTPGKRPRGRAWNRFDLDALGSLASADLVVSNPLMPEETRDLESFKQLLRTVQAGIPDLHFDLRHVATEVNTAAFSWEAAGTHTGAMLGLDPTGRPVRWSGLAVVEVSAGRVVEEWGEEDALDLFRQLGVVPG
ncbi:MAG: ester cyclase [Candidatus Limnocylindrales bacterium]